MSVVFFLLTIHTALAVDECKFDAGKLYSFDKIQTCINTIPDQLNVSEAQSLITTIQEYLDSYVFLDINSFPPSPFNGLKLDLIPKLTEIVDSKLNTPGWGTFDFWWEISKLISSMNDAHTSFSPCDTTFLRWVLPFTFRVDGQSKTIIAKSNSYTAEHLNNTSETDISNAVITKIDVGDGFVDAWQALDNFAASLTISKNQNTRFNVAVSGRFSLRVPFQIAPPGAFLRVEFQIDENSTNETQIPFYSVSDMSYSTSDDICPLKTNETNEGVEDSVDADKKSALKSSARTKRVTEALAAAYKRSQMEFGAKMRTELSLMKELSRPQECPKTGVGNQTQTLSQTHTRMHTHKKNPVEKVTDSNFQQIFDKDYGNAYVYTDGAGKKTGYLRISAFITSKPETESDWASTVGGALKAIKVTHGAENLIIDVSQNGGGSVALGMGLSALLFPSEYPASGIYDIRKSDFFTFLNEIEVLSSMFEMLDPDTLEINPDFYTADVEKEFKWADGTTFEHNYTTRFKVGEDDPYVSLKAAWPDRGWAPLYAPQHLVVLTDGFCGSTCSVFIKRIQEEKQARLVQFGGHIKTGVNPPSDFDVGSFAGGSVISSSMFDVIRVVLSQIEAEYGAPAGMLVGNVPKAFPRKGSELSFAFMEVFSFTQPDVLLEFKVNPPDFVEPFYPPYKESNDPDFVASVLNPVVSYFNRCASWENQADEVNCVATAGENKINGHPCRADGTGWESTCAFSRCADGHHLTTTAPANAVGGPPYCVPSPGWTPPLPPTPTPEGPGAALHLHQQMWKNRMWVALAAMFMWALWMF